MKFLCCDKLSMCGWLSGFLAAGSFAHFVQAVFGFSLVIGGYAVSRGLSAGICVVLGMISISLCWVGHKHP